MLNDKLQMSNICASFNDPYGKSAQGGGINVVSVQI